MVVLIGCITLLFLYVAINFNIMNDRENKHVGPNRTTLFQTHLFVPPNVYHYRNLKEDDTHLFT